MKKPSSCLNPNLATIIAAHLCFLSTPLLAKEPVNFMDMPFEQLLDVKISVASLVEESALDAASSVSLLTSDNWRKSGAKRLGDALESVPSIITYSSFGGSEAIAIRGYGTELSVRGIANSLDGVPLNTYTFATSFYDKPIISLNLLDRVEVIRGPGSTLYGSDAFHGVLAYQTLSSEDDVVEVSGSVGDPSYGSGTLFANQNFGGINLSFGLDRMRQGERNLEYEYTSPYDGITYKAERDFQYENSTGFLALEGGDQESGKWRFSTYASDFESQDFAGAMQQFFVRLVPVFDILNGNIPQDRDHSDQFSNFVMSQLDYSLALSSNITLDSQIYWWTSNQEWQFDFSRYPLSIDTRTAITLPCATSTASPNPLFCPHTLVQSADETRRGVQTVLKGASDSGATQWVGGLGWDTLKIDDSRFKRIGIDDTVYVDEANPAAGRIREVGYAFAQAKTELLQDRLQLVYGLRYDHYSDVDSHTSPRAGLIYTLNDQYTSKLLYGHAYRAPTANERFGTFGVAVGNEDIKSEIMDTVEWVNIFHSDQSRHELTLFYSEWEDGIILTPLPGPGPTTTQIYVNTGDNTSKGIELSSLFNIGAWRLAGSASYVKSENEVSSLDYSAFPRWLMTLEAGYVFHGQDLEIYFKERMMRDYGVGDVLGTIVPEDASNYYRTDFSVAKRFAGKDDASALELSLNLYNIFDRDNVMPSVYNAESGLPDDGRTFVMSARLSL